MRACTFIIRVLLQVSYFLSGCVHAGHVKFVFAFAPNEAKCPIAEHHYKSMLQYIFCSPILNVIKCRVVTNEKKKKNNTKMPSSKEQLHVMIALAMNDGQGKTKEPFAQDLIP